MHSTRLGNENIDTDVARAEKDILNEETEEWLSGHPTSIALLMANKREQRLGKNKIFNGFVIPYHDLERFIQLLKTNADQIPEGTRLSIAVASFIEFDNENRAHWTAIDILIEKNGVISSFVLDAVNAAGFKEMHHLLKSNFPNGHHYLFQGDTIIVDKKKKIRLIQYSGIGCRVFTIDQLRQLSQIDNETLYKNELPAVANSKGVFFPGKLIAGLKLARIFRAMQSWTGLMALPAEVRNTYIKEGSTLTLEQSIAANMENKINTTINKKNSHCKMEKCKYFKTLSPELRLLIMQQRDGFLFIKHPILLKLNAALASADETQLESYVNKLNILLHDSLGLNLADDLSRNPTLTLAAKKNIFLMIIANYMQIMQEALQAVTKLSLIIENYLQLFNDKNYEDIKIHIDNKVEELMVKKINDMLDKPSLNHEELSEVIDLLLKTQISPSIFKERFMNLRPYQKSIVNNIIIKLDEPRLFELVDWNFPELIAIDKDGNNILHRLAQIDASNMLRYAIQKNHNEDLLAKNDDDMMPIHLAAFLGHANCLRVLVEYSTTINVVNDDQDSPLHFATRKGHKECIKLLLAHGADVSLKNSDDETPLDVAKKLYSKYSSSLMPAHNDIVNLFNPSDENINTPSPKY